MERIIDKVIIIIFQVIAMYNHIHGNYLIILLYGSITIAALNIYLSDIRERKIMERPKGSKEMCAYILQIVFLVLMMLNPYFLFFLPIVIYDVCEMRNGIGYLMATAVYINAIYMYFGRGEMVYKEMGKQTCLFVGVICLLSVYLEINTEKKYLLKEKYIGLRDDMTINQEMLINKNKEIINAKDVEIYSAQLSERNRIAREIHDNVGHMLSRAILQMGALLSIYKEEPLRTHLSEVRETLDGAMNSIRSSVHDLHDESLDVKLQIENMAKALEEKYTVYMDIDVDDDMQRDVKYAIIGVIKESISNIIKYSKNSNVDIKVISHPSMYQLTVHDYGNEEKRKTIINDTGMGLYNIRNRIGSVGGIVNIITEDGFKVFATIPKKSKK